MPFSNTHGKVGMNRWLRIYRYRYFNILVCLVYIIAICLAGVPPVSAKSENHRVLGGIEPQNTPDCTPLDMVFIIDQTDVEEDPGKIRNQVVRWAETLMSADQLYRCPNTEHHIMWLDMDTNTTDRSLPIEEPLIELGSIPMPEGIDPTVDQSMETFYNWQGEIQQDFTDISLSIPSSDTRNYLNSIKAALDALKDEQHDGDKKVIILIGGEKGIPCTGVCSKDDLAYKFYPNIIKEVDAFGYSELTGPFIYMLAFQDVRNSFGPDWLNYEQYAGQIDTVTGKFGGATIPIFQDQIPLVFEEVTNIFQKYTSETFTKVSSRKYPIEPFIKDLLFLIFLPPDVEGPTITPPEENPIPFSSSGVPVNSDENMRFKDASNPYPGNWDIAAENDVLTYVHSIPMEDVRLETSGVMENYYQTRLDAPGCKSSEGSLAFQLKDQFGKIINYEAEIEAWITSPSGVQKDLSFTFDKDTYQYKLNASLPVNESGTYTWNIKVVYPVGNGEVPIAELTDRTYTVASVQQVKPVVDQPGTEQTLHGQPFGDDWLKIKPVKL